MTDPTRRQLLGSAAALALTGLPVPAAARTRATVRGQTWTNWAGNVTFEAERIATPRSVDEVAALVRASSAAKAVGSGHSFNRSPETSGTLISLERLDRVVDVGRDRVTVEAGLTVREAGRRLAQHGLVVPSLGNSFYQTLAGVISTATHGSGMRWGTLSDGDSVLGLELVDGTGERRRLVDEDDTLAAARVGLGALGVITQVTLRVEPMHDLLLRRGVVGLEEGLDPEQWARHDHYELFWIPFTDTCFTVTRDRTEERRRHRGALVDGWQDWAVEYVGLTSLLRPAAREPARTPEVMARLAGMVKPFEAVDRADRAMTNPRHLRAFDLELALPIERAREALDAVRAATDEWGARGEFYLNLPVQLRFVRGDRGTFLSPAQGRDTVFVDVGTYHRYAGWEGFFADVDRRLRDLGGRPHWGKVFAGSPRDAYPDFARWEAVRARLDPEGRFLNPFVRALIGA